VESDFGGKLEDCPMWSFDGSSTEQADGGSSDCLLKPVAIFPDPARRDAYLVMCEVLNADGTAHESNGRATIDDDDNEVSPGGRGHLVLSNLTNRATVLLNYRLGDIVTLGHSTCSCGRNLPTIENIDGRSDDLIRLANGDPLHALAVLEKLQKVPGVAQIQLVQEAPERFVIRAIAAKTPDRAQTAAELVSNLRSV